MRTTSLIDEMIRMRRAAAAAALCALALAAAVSTSVHPAAAAALPAPANALDLKSDAVTDLKGHAVSALPATSRATVLIFILHDCPVCNQYAPEISRIAADYAKQGVSTYVVYEERDLTLTQARLHAKTYALKCGCLYDPTHKLAVALGASSAPDAVVISAAGAPVYQGRIDDRFVHFGMANPTPSERDLRDAIDETLAGKPVATPSTAVIGCELPRD